MTEAEIWAALRILADVYSKLAEDGEIPPGMAKDLTVLMLDATALLRRLRALTVPRQEEIR